jgi:hypothetical protein
MYLVGIAAFINKSGLFFIGDYSKMTSSKNATGGTPGIKNAQE